jgi:predicted RNA-binding Zn-ribbon protein involved in translation (DUF1610 family)
MVTPMKPVASARVVITRAQAPIVMTMAHAKPCPECGQQNLFVTTAYSGSRSGLMLLPGLAGNSSGFAEFEVVVCPDCGLTRLFAAPDACGKLHTTNNWKRI